MKKECTPPCKDLIEEQGNRKIIETKMDDLSTKVQELKSDTKEWFSELKELIKWLDKKYVPIAEHNSVIKDINTLFAIIKWFSITFLWWWAFAMISFFWNKILELITK